MNETLKFRKKWETGQEKEERTVILGAPLEIVEISRKPFSIRRRVLLLSTTSGEISYLMTNGRLHSGIRIMILF